MIKAILFDLDGVIVDTEPLHFKAHKQALALYGVELTLEDYLEYGVGARSEYFYNALNEKYQTTINSDIVHKDKRKIYANLLPEVQVIDGILEKVSELSLKYQLYVVSSTPIEFIENILLQTNLRNYFKQVFSAHNSKRGKPYPDVYIDTIAAIGILPQECIAIEDSENGVTSATGAGIYCIAIPNSYTLKHDFSKASLVISNVQNLNI